MPHVLTVGRGRPPMPSGADVWSDGAVCRQEPLGGPCRRQSWPPPCPLAGRLVGVFRTVRQLAMRAVLHARQEVPLRRPIAFQRLREDDAWHRRQALEQLPEELVRSLRLPPALPENIESMAVLIHRAPPIMPRAVDGENDLIEMPCSTRLWAAPPQLVGLLLAKSPTPLADGLIGHDEPTSAQERFHVTIAETAPAIQPDTVADDLGRKAVRRIAVDRWGVHAPSMSHRVGTGHVALNKLTMPIALLRTSSIIFTCAKKSSGGLRSPTLREHSHKKQVNNV